MKREEIRKKIVFNNPTKKCEVCDISLINNFNNALSKKEAIIILNGKIAFCSKKCKGVWNKLK